MIGLNSKETNKTDLRKPPEKLQENITILPFKEQPIVYAIQAYKKERSYIDH